MAATPCCTAPSLSSSPSSLCMRSGMRDEDTAACEAEFGCTQDVSTITVSETAEGEGGGGQGREAEGVADKGEGEGEGEVRRDAQHLFFFALAVASREAVREDNSAYETEFGCLQGVFVAPPRSDCDEVEGGGSGERGRMGVRMRMV